jgi:ribosomal protein L16 Arg81 hydroxylase
MAKTTQEKIELKMAEKEQLENELKRLMQQHKAEERKARTNRLCKRHGLFESLLEGTIPLTEDNFKTFLEKTVANDFGRRTLAALKTAQEKDTVAAIGVEAAARGGEAVPAKPTNPAQSDGRAPADKPARITTGNGATSAVKAGEPPKRSATS